ncbi:hypothetical protein [Mycolicibacter hiberniae]|uniref:Uncharacterized protein n=1 Tax=Mycolicibacter hiberniae TaxID=29314 RepID=A0A7I7WVS4_9MYCO|nr:hypothetical protein [Mycolicibacter hiberniae]MCV7086974.1 hypothetical protein [Mycolicibacter hiberniae]BBZ21726.1 hypothetical protein MHIB_01440 [Mycolicibacter hiberniae]
MSDIRWWSQPFPPEGGQTAEGIKRQLGRPGLPEYAVLVREAVQNSWDARRDDREGPVDVRIELRRLGAGAPTWREILGTSSESGKGRGLLNKLHSNSWILTVSDRGTNGLGGPIRSDEPAAAGVSADFVQFIRNVGEPRDKHLGGGTYGFGKGIFYRISEASAILVDTLNTEGNARSRRLMGAALGGVETTPSDRRLTGRHWWGEINDDVPDPLIGAVAEAVASDLGLPGFADGRTGTDVVVILPNLELDDINSDPGLLGERLRAYLYWYLWPKMGSQIRRQDIHFSLYIDGDELELPPLEALPVLSDFAKSLDNVHSRRGNDFMMTTHTRQYGRLGHVSIEFTMPGLLSGPSKAWRSIEQIAPMQRPYRHIARMRQTELVVDYFEGEPMPTTDIGYVGSFVVSPAVDELFAQAEPPTHDTWEVGTLAGAAKGIVQGSKRFLSDECRKQVETRTGARSKAVQGLGRLSSSLGALVQGATGTRPVGSGKRPPGRSNGSSGTGPSTRVKTLRASHLVVDGDTSYVEYVVEVPNTVPEGATISASASVVLAGGRSENPDDAPAGSARTEVLCWYFEGDPSDRVLGGELAGGDIRKGRWTARARALDDVSVRISVSQGVTGGQ